MAQTESVLIGEESNSPSAFRCIYKYRGTHLFCISYGYSFNEIYQEYEAGDFFGKPYSNSAVEELRRAKAEWVLPLCQAIVSGKSVTPEQVFRAAASHSAGTANNSFKADS